MNNLVKKGVAFTVIILFISVSVAQSIGLNVTENNSRIVTSETEAIIPCTTNHNGSLSGYVNDTYMNPIEGVLVRVYFHGTYEENYTDSSGYYHVTSIPLCWCVKNATASKEGYKTEWVWLIIRENTTYDFILTPKNSPCYPVLIGTMGNNGWYVSCVEINFTTDDNVSTVYYSIDNGSWETFDGLLIEVCDDGSHTICWYYIDNEGNQSAVECIEFKIDQTIPTIDLTWESPDNIHVEFTATCSDATSGMDRVEFYLNGELCLVDNSEPYEWVFVWPPLPYKYFVKGLICDKQFDEQNVTFYVFLVLINEYLPEFWIDAIAYDMAGNWDSDIDYNYEQNNRTIHLFKYLIFPNNYTGRIGLFFINAEFEESPL